LFLLCGGFELVVGEFKRFYVLYRNKIVAATGENNGILGSGRTIRVEKSLTSGDKNYAYLLRDSASCVEERLHYSGAERKKIVSGGGGAGCFLYKMRVVPRAAMHR
jgi:hypothetical protein